MAGSANKLTRTQRKRINIALVVFWAFLVFLLFRTSWIQFVRGEDLSRRAVAQQTLDMTIPARRGTIYDRSGAVPLAVSMTVEQVRITPIQVRESGHSDIVADGLAEIFDLDRDWVMSRIEMRAADVSIRRRIEREEADTVRAWMEELRGRDVVISGVHITEDIKRHYQFNNLAAHVIGHVGDDLQGLNGIESAFERYLSGTPGRVISAADGRGREMANRFARFENPQDGLNVVLTIDESIQHFAEKHLGAAVYEHRLAMGAAAIVMDVQTGEILAMATKPNFDLNAPFAFPDGFLIHVNEPEPNTNILRRIFVDPREWIDREAGEERVNRLTIALNQMWRNKAVADAYEPGSTFKIATAAMALEEGVVSLNDMFYCRGSLRRGTHDIRCHNRNGHGMQTFAEAIQNSCNPAFIEMAERMGRTTFHNYMYGMGFRQRMGIELPGEQTGQFFPLSAFNEVELATSSFGQGPTVTPLQLITIVSAIANGGEMFRPHLVKQLTDMNGNVVQNFEPQLMRQIVSRQTSDTLNSILERAVSDGTGRNAYIPGFRVAGKTGTSEKLPRGNQNYIASFVGFAPADNPRIAVLVILDEPRGASHFGGVIAAPVARNILEESLLYLNIEPEFTEAELANMEIPVPDLIQLSRDEATSRLNEVGLTAQFHGTGDVVISQIPRRPEMLARGSTVVLYTEGAEMRTAVVPNVVGMSVTDANRAIVNTGLNIRVRGFASRQGRLSAASQFPEAGTVIDAGAIVTVEFRHLDVELGVGGM